jgi:hypothetical protein
MHKDELPADLVAFLESGRRLEYDTSACEIGVFTFRSLEEVEEIDLTVRDERHESTSVIRALDLLKACESHDPRGILVYIPSMHKFGSYDDELKVLTTFRGMAWSDFLADPAGYLNAAWEFDHEIMEVASSESAGDRVVEGSSCLTRLEIAELACKILALWIFAQAALGITPVLLFCFVAFFQHSSGSVFAAVTVSALMPLGFLFVGVLLWKKAEAIARRMVGSDPTPVVRTELDAKGLMSIAFAAIGLYAVWASSEDLFRKIAQVFLIVHEQGIDRANIWGNINWNASLLGTLGSLAFAVWLLLGSRGIVRIVQRIRGNGQTSSENVTSNGETLS